MISTLKNLVLLILFHSIFFLYRIVAKVKRLAYLIVSNQNCRMIVSMQQPRGVITQINSLKKLPRTVYCVSLITKESIHQQNSLNNISILISQYAYLIAGSNVEQVTVHIQCPSSQQFNDQLKIQVAKKINKKKQEQTKIVSKIKLSDSFQFQSQGFCYSQQLVSLKSAPLVIIFSNYKGISGIPYSYLVDSQLAFCSQITKSSPLQIVQSFRQYCFSKQRNGK